MVIPELVIDSRGGASKLCFGGYEVVCLDYEVATFQTFIRQAEISVRFDFDEAEVCSSPAEASMRFLQGIGPPRKFYITDKRGVLGIAGHEFEARAEIKVYTVPVEITGHGLIMPTARQLPPVSKNFWVLILSATHRKV